MNLSIIKFPAPIKLSLHFSMKQTSFLNASTLILNFRCNLSIRKIDQANFVLSQFSLQPIFTQEVDRSNIKTWT